MIASTRWPTRLRSRRLKHEALPLTAIMPLAMKGERQGRFAHEKDFRLAASLCDLRTEALVKVLHEKIVI